MNPFCFNTTLTCLLILVSPSVAQDAESWIPVKAERAGASVRLPASPRSYSRVLRPVADQDPIRINVYQATKRSGMETFVFTYHDENQTPRNRVQIKRFLDGAVKGGVARVLGKLESQKEIVISKHRGRDFVYTCTQHAPNETDLKIRTRVLMVGSRVYQMNYIAEKSHYSDELADEFFETFRFEKIPNDLPPIPRPGRGKVAKS